MSTGSILEFRRRHSSLTSNSPMTSSVILLPNIFRTNFRPLSLQAHDYRKPSSKKKILIKKTSDFFLFKKIFKMLLKQN